MTQIGIQKKEQSTKHMTVENICSCLFFATYVLNNTFGDVASLMWISKSAIFIFMAFTIFMVLEKQTKFSTIVVFFFVSNFAWWMISCVWSPGNVAQISTLGLNMLFGFCVFLFFSETKDFNLFFRAMFFSGFLLIIYSMSVYGMDGFLSLLQEEERLGAEITNENTYGMIFSYAFLAGMYFALYQSKIHYTLGSVLFLFFSLSSGSRKAILIILIGTIILVVLRFGLKHPLKLFIGLILSIFVVYYVLQLPIFGGTLERFEMLLSNDNKDASSKERYRMIFVGWELFKEKVVAGWGIGGFAAVSGFGKYSHNNFVEILVNFGVVGFSLYYSMHFYVLKNLFKKLKTIYPQHIMMFTCILVSLIMDYGNVSFVVKWMWIYIGVALALASITARDDKKTKI